MCIHVRAHASMFVWVCTHAVVTYYYLFQDTQFTCSFTIDIVSDCCLTVNRTIIFDITNYLYYKYCVSGHYPSKNTILFILQNTTFCRLDSVSIFR
jgi:hypothetical protein